MRRLESYQNYMSSAYSYFRFLYESHKGKTSKDKEIILENNYINGAKIAFLANILTGIKEDIVSKDNGYSSKVILEKLEDTVNIIATKTTDGYEIDGYNFNSAAEIVSVIRNKIAHGKYSLDLDSNKIIFHMESQDFSLSIKSFSNFVVKAIGNYLNDKEDRHQVRHVTYVEPSNLDTIKTESSIRGLIKKIHTKTFEIKTKDGSKLSPATRKAFENLLVLYRKKGDEILSLKEYKDICAKFEESENIEFSVRSNSFNYKAVESLVPEIKSKIFDNENLSIVQKIKMLLYLLERNNKLYENKYSNLMSNFNNLILIDAIETSNSIEYEKINEYFNSKYSNEFVYSGHEFVSSIIAMFNPAFQYLFDEIYVKPGEYSSDRNGYFDFSKIDISWLKDEDMFYTISDKTYLDNLKLRLNKICNTIDILHEKINKQNMNLAKVDSVKQANSKAVIAIKEDINKSTIRYQQLVSERIMLETLIDDVENDLQSDYFKNRAIIEGIRNSISHGNYDVKVNYQNPFDSVITFKDIYEGKETFKLEISAYDFMQFILNNIKEPTLFVQNKLNCKKKI